MNPDAASTFVTTRWTRVLAARGDSDAARIALSELCSAYYGPVVSFLTHTGCGEDDPREVAPEFFALLMARNGVSGADPDRGRFRSYLLGAVKHHIANRRLRASREKRGGTVQHQPLESESDTSLEVPLPAPAILGLDSVFDREWALAVVERALAVLADEAAVAGTGPQFTAMKVWLTFDAAPGSQAETAARLGMNEGAVKVAIHRLRRRFREIIRAEIAQTLPAGDDLDAEMRHLVEALADR